MRRRPRGGVRVVVRVVVRVLLGPAERGGLERNRVVRSLGSVALDGFLGDRGSVDFAYQHDMFSEIRPEFGASKSYTLSVGISF